MNKASLLSHLGDSISEILYILIDEKKMKDNRRYGGLLHVARIRLPFCIY
jgi:hypothetical protein